MRATLTRMEGSLAERREALDLTRAPEPSSVRVVHPPAEAKKQWELGETVRIVPPGGAEETPVVEETTEPVDSPMHRSEPEPEPVMQPEPEPEPEPVAESEPEPEPEPEPETAPEPEPEPVAAEIVAEVAPAPEPAPAAPASAPAANEVFALDAEPPPSKAAAPKATGAPVAAEEVFSLDADAAPATPAAVMGDVGFSLDADDHKPAPKPERTEKPARPPHKPGGPQGKPHGGQQARGQKPAQAGRPGGDRPGGGSGGAPGKGPPGRRQPGDRPQGQGRPARTQEEIDLAKAYAIRAQREKEERIEAERLKQEEARLRREAKAKLAELIKDKALNDKDAELVRHFEYGGKIKRIYVNAAQLKALNAGELGVVQQNGRYLLVTAAVLAEAETIFAPAIALKVDPDAPAADDPYADPQYQVPDDLVW